MIMVCTAAGFGGVLCYRQADHAYREEKANLYLPKIERVHTMAEIEKEWIRGKQGLLSGYVSEADLDTAWKYIDWHCQKYMEWNGEIPDFAKTSDGEQAEKPDSVDAYIAVFLSLLCRKAEITGT